MLGIGMLKLWPWSASARLSNMDAEKLEKLQQQIAASPRLSRVADDLQSELSRRSNPDRVGFIDPITIIMIISVIIQVLNYCRNRNKRGVPEICYDVRQADKLPPRRTIVLRRRMRKLWAEYCQKNNIEETADNPFLAAALAVAPTLDENTVQEFVALSE